MIDLDKIESAARTATPGPWIQSHDAWSQQIQICVGFSYPYPDSGAGNYPVVSRVGGDLRGDEAELPTPEQNASYLELVDPPSALELVAEIRRLREVENGVIELQRSWLTELSGAVGDTARALLWHHAAQLRDAIERTPG